VFSWCPFSSITIPASVSAVGYGSFAEWGPSQTIIIQGKASEAAADAAWGADWRYRCNANIIYGN